MSDALPLPDADGLLTVMLWRQSLVRGPRVPQAPDLEAWIRHLEDSGVPCPLLERCTAILRGGTGEAMISDHVPERWTIAVALDELAALAARLGSSMTLAGKARPGWSGTPDNPAGIAHDRDNTLPGDLQTLADDLLESMAADGVEADRRLLASLTRLRDLHRRFPQLDYRELRHAPLPALMAAIGLVTLMDFALRTQDLWETAYGSAALMRAASRLSTTGLGAYGSGVGLIARSSADVYDLARAAVAASPDAPGDAREAWICFLCRDCCSDLLIEVIDDLGDIAASRSLAMILQQVSNRIDVDVPLLWRIRDAALDNGDLSLAIKAQWLVAEARDQDGGEMLILGSLYVGAGQIAAGAATFRALTARNWPGAEARLEALQTGSFAPYIIDRGYTSPVDRQATRLHRRGEPHNYPRAKGGRIDAVDVG